MNIAAMMKGAKEMQKRMETAKAEVAELRCTGTSGGSMVSVVATGNNTIEAITIAPELLQDGDADMLSDMLLLACNDALGQVKAASDRMYADIMPQGMPAGLSGLL